MEGLHRMGNFSMIQIALQLPGLRKLQRNLRSIWEWTASIGTAISSDARTPPLLTKFDWFSHTSCCAGCRPWWESVSESTAQRLCHLTMDALHCFRRHMLQQQLWVRLCCYGAIGITLLCLFLSIFGTKSANVRSTGLMAFPEETSTSTSALSRHVRSQFSIRPALGRAAANTPTPLKALTLAP